MVNGFAMCLDRILTAGTYAAKGDAGMRAHFNLFSNDHVFIERRLHASCRLGPSWRFVRISIAATRSSGRNLVSPKPDVKVGPNPATGCTKPQETKS